LISEVKNCGTCAGRGGGKKTKKKQTHQTNTTKNKKKKKIKRSTDSLLWGTKLEQVSADGEKGTDSANKIPPVGGDREVDGAYKGEVLRSKREDLCYLVNRGVWDTKKEETEAWSFYGSDALAPRKQKKREKENSRAPYG